MPKSKRFSQKNPITIVNVEYPIKNKLKNIQHRTKLEKNLPTNMDYNKSEHGLDTLTTIYKNIRKYYKNDTIYFGDLIPIEFSQEKNNTIYITPEANKVFINEEYSFSISSASMAYSLPKMTKKKLFNKKVYIELSKGHVKKYDKLNTEKKLKDFLFDCDLLFVDFYKKSDSDIANASFGLGKFHIQSSGNFAEFFTKLPIARYDASRFRHFVGGIINYPEKHEKNGLVLYKFISPNGKLCQHGTSSLPNFTAAEKTFVADSPISKFVEMSKTTVIVVPGTSTSGPKVSSKSYIAQKVFSEHKSERLSILAMENLIIHSLDDRAWPIDGKSKETSGFWGDYVKDRHGYKSIDVFNKQRRSTNTSDTINGEGLDYCQDYGFGRFNVVKANLLARSYPINIATYSEDTVTLNKKVKIKNFQKQKANNRNISLTNYISRTDIKVPEDFLSRAVRLKVTGKNIPRKYLNDLELITKSYNSQFLTPVSSFNFYVNEPKNYVKNTYLEDGICNIFKSHRPYSVINKKDENLTIQMMLNVSDKDFQLIKNEEVELELELIGERDYQKLPSIHTLTSYGLKNRKNKKTTLNIKAKAIDWINASALVQDVFDEKSEAKLFGVKQYNLFKRLTPLNVIFDMRNGLGKVHDPFTNSIQTKLSTKAKNIITAIGKDQIILSNYDSHVETWEGSDIIDASSSSGNHKIKPGSGSDIVRCGSGKEIIVFNPTDFRQNYDDINTILSFDSSQDKLILKFESELNKDLYNKGKKVISLVEQIFNKAVVLNERSNRAHLNIAGCKVNFRNKKGSLSKSIYACVNTLDWFQLNTDTKKFEAIENPFRQYTVADEQFLHDIQFIPEDVRDISNLDLSKTKGRNIIDLRQGEKSQINLNNQERSFYIPAGTHINNLTLNEDVENLVTLNHKDNMINGGKGGGNIIYLRDNWVDINNEVQSNDWGHDIYYTEKKPRQNPDTFIIDLGESNSRKINFIKDGDSLKVTCGKKSSLTITNYAANKVNILIRTRNDELKELLEKKYNSKLSQMVLEQGMKKIKGAGGLQERMASYDNKIYQASLQSKPQQSNHYFGLKL